MVFLWSLYSKATQTGSGSFRNQTQADQLLGGNGSTVQPHPLSIEKVRRGLGEPSTPLRAAVLLVWQNHREVNLLFQSNLYIIINIKAGNLKGRMVDDTNLDSFSSP